MNLWKNKKYFYNNLHKINYKYYQINGIKLYKINKQFQIQKIKYNNF